MSSLKLSVIASGSDGNCYILDNGRYKLLLDCGIPWKKIRSALNNNISDVCGCLVTHAHLDHAYAIQDLLRYGINVYTNKEVCYGFNDSYWLHLINPMQKFQILDYMIIGFQLPHNSFLSSTGELVPCMNFGWFIHDSVTSESILYCTDMEFIPFRFRKHKINHFLVECNHTYEEMDVDEVKYQHSLKGHMSLDTLLRFLDVNVTDECKNIILCHLSKDSCDKERVLSEISNRFPKVNVEIAQKGLIV